MVQIATISKNENIPHKFLESILLTLKKSGFLGSKKGKGGGYYLLKEASERMTAVGDRWRMFALECAKIVKNKESRVDLPEIAQLLRRCGDSEKQIYRMLKTVK